jgi:hypothetical protein
MKILFLDDETVRHDLFDQTRTGDEIHHAYTLEQFEKALARVEKFDVISFDHDLGPGADGYDCAMLLLSRIPYANWPRECWVHSWNPVGAERIVRGLRAAGIPTARRPFAFKEST